jgi:drug/metabolite transporter (DMT)-like permease
MDHGFLGQFVVNTLDLKSSLSHHGLGTLCGICIGVSVAWLFYLICTEPFSDTRDPKIEFIMSSIGLIFGGLFGWIIWPLAIVMVMVPASVFACLVFLACFIGIPIGSYLGITWGLREMRNERAVAQAIRAGEKDFAMF